MVFAASLPCYLYICWRLTASCNLIAPHRSGQLRLLLILVGVWYAGFPLACQIAY